MKEMLLLLGPNTHVELMRGDFVDSFIWGQLVKIFLIEDVDHNSQSYSQACEVIG